jgi:hypothetical protein
LRRGLKIILLRHETISDELLRVAIIQRRLGALNLDHNNMTFQKGMVVPVQSIPVFVHPIRHNRFRMWRFFLVNLWALEEPIIVVVIFKTG